MMVMIKLISNNEVDKLELHKGPLIKDFRTLGGRGFRKNWANADRGRGWLTKCGLPLEKKIIATIFAKLTQMIW